MTAKYLSERERRTLLAAAECVLPAGGAFPLGHADVDVVAFTNEYLEAVPKEVRILLHVILWFVEYLGFFFALRPSRFSKMPLDKRDRVLDRMRSSRVFFLRGFYILLTTVLMIPFYRDHRVLDAIGYSGYQAGVNKLRTEGA